MVSMAPGSSCLGPVPPTTGYAAARASAPPGSRWARVTDTPTSFLGGLQLLPGYPHHVLPCTSRTGTRERGREQARRGPA